MERSRDSRATIKNRELMKTESSMMGEYFREVVHHHEGYRMVGSVCKSHVVMKRSRSSGLVSDHEKEIVD